MRACMCGQTSAALFLHSWNSSVMKVRNYDGESCLELAGPFDDLAAELKRREEEADSSFARPAATAAASKAAFSKKSRDGDRWMDEQSLTWASKWALYISTSKGARVAVLAMAKSILVRVPFWPQFPSRVTRLVPNL